jgi:polyisoprenoid-binding protein YceI
MKKIFQFAVLSLCAILFYSFFIPSTQVFRVNEKTSSLIWKASKVTGKHNGRISIAEGKIEFDSLKITGGIIKFDMTSIVNDDLTDSSYNAKLVNHLKSEDFFNVNAFPVSTFEFTKVTSSGEDRYEVTGNLTIKGITNPITFPATIKVTGETLVAVGTATVDRTLYDIKYGSGKFFKNIGDKAIHDDFLIEFNIAAQKE